MNEQSRALDWPAPEVNCVAAYLSRFHAVGGAVTFNLLCYQDGSALPSDLNVMKSLKRLFR